MMPDFAVVPLPLPHVHVFGHPEGYYVIQCGASLIAVIVGRDNAQRIRQLIDEHGLLLEIA